MLGLTTSPDGPASRGNAEAVSFAGAVLLPIKIVATSGRVGVHETDLPEGGWFPATPGSSTEITGILREIAVSEF